jgi:hypothetical protein
MKTAAQPEGQRRYHPAGQLRFDLDLASTCQLALKKHCKYRISRNAFDWQNHNDLAKRGVITQMGLPVIDSNSHQ